MAKCIMTNCPKSAPADEAMCSEHRDRDELSGDIYQDLSDLAKRVAILEKVAQQEKTP